MARRYETDNRDKVYVGGLPADASVSELEEVFGRFGRLRKVWVAHRPPGFAFVEFEDPRDADDSARELDGTRICGVKARVELSHGKRRNEGRGGGRGGFRGGYGGGDRRGGGGGGGGYGARREDYPPRYNNPRGRSRSPRGRSRSPPPVRRSRSHSKSHSRSRSR